MKIFKKNSQIHTADSSSRNSAGFCKRMAAFFAELVLLAAKRSTGRASEFFFSLLFCQDSCQNIGRQQNEKYKN